jgi:hypothetical protein
VRTLWAYGRLFDNLFFFGSLLVERRVIWRLDPRKVLETGYRGICREPRNGITRIEICDNNEVDGSGDAIILAKVVTVLHELLHAFLGLYACNYCYDNWEEGGKSHGMAFLDAMFALHKGAPKLLGRSLNHRPDCEVLLAAEINDGGANGKISSAETLKRWDISHAELVELVVASRGSVGKRTKSWILRKSKRIKIEIKDVYLKLIGFYSKA